jgi:biotin transporter BioY
MKEIIARSLLAVAGFLLGYLLMAFVVGSLDATQWTIDQRSFIAISEAILIVMITTYPIKLTE